MLPLRLCGSSPTELLPSSWWYSLTFDISQLAAASCCSLPLSSHGILLLCLFPSCENTSHLWIWAHPNDLILNWMHVQRPFFQNTVTFTGASGQDFSIIFWGDTMQPIIPPTHTLLFLLSLRCPVVSVPERWARTKSERLPTMTPAWHCCCYC